MRSVTPVLALLLATGCGAGISESAHQKTVDELASCKAEKHSCNTTRDNQARRIERLESELGDARAERDKRAAELRTAENKLSGLQGNLKASERELADLRAQKAAAEQRLTAFRKLTERFRKLADTGKLRVDFRNGQMVIRLGSEVLFAPGSADLSEDGQATLAQVMQTLVDFRDRKFMVAGHTDDREVYGRARRGPRFKTSWELSVARAVTVVEFMVDYGFSPANLAATGYGEFDPIASNGFEGDRQLNRRVEIILVPDLSELPNLAKDPVPGS